MFLESFYYEGRFDVSAELADRFVAKYPDRPRELSMGLLFQGSAHKMLGDYPKAKEALVRVLETEWPQMPEESWGSEGSRWDMKLKAADLLRGFAREFGDEEGMTLSESYLR